MSSEEYYTTGQVAVATGLPRWKLMYLIERGAVPGPSVQVPGRRLFTQCDVAAIRARLAGMGVAGLYGVPAAGSGG